MTEQVQEPQQFDRNALKVLSLKERFATKIADLEDEIAGMRADYTILNNAMQGRMKELENENESLKAELGGSEDVAEEEAFTGE